MTSTSPDYTFWRTPLISICTRHKQGEQINWHIVLLPKSRRARRFAIGIALDHTPWTDPEDHARMPFYHREPGRCITIVVNPVLFRLFLHNQKKTVEKS